MEAVKKELNQLIDLLRKEWQEDLLQYNKLVLNTSFTEKLSNGVSWYPVVITRQSFQFSKSPFIEVERTMSQPYPHAFQSGKVVAFYSNQGGNYSDKRVNGVVNYVKNHRMGITLSTLNMPQWLNEGKLGVDILFDEVTYREMEKAVNEVLHTEDKQQITLRNILLGAETPSYRKLEYFPNKSLNPNQNIAVEKILAANEVAAIHGPPGTGKTTTIVEAIFQTVSEGKSVLVCAPSNAATDLLVEKLAAKEIRVLRLGHPARITEDILSHTLDYQMVNQPDYADIKKMRQQADEFRKLALKYKRNYGKAERDQRKSLLNEASSLRSQADQWEFYVTQKLLSEATVIATTLTGASAQVIQNKQFEVVFIDEASQALEPSTWIPILKGEKIVFAGDHHQLPPTVKSREAGAAGLNVTLFEKCVSRNNLATLLNIQYRMHPAIMGFSNQVFYDNKLMAAENTHIHQLFQDDQVIEFVDTAGCGYQEFLNKENNSLSNKGEAEVLFKHFRLYLNHLKQEKIELNELSIGIISPYREQVILLHEQLQAEPLAPELLDNITIDTIDAFQGRERDIIYISLVRSNEKGEIGFLKDTRRLNVAMTRARMKLVMFGDSATLASSDFYLEMIGYFESLAAHRSVYEFMYD